MEKKIEKIGWEDASPPEEISKWGVMIENRINYIIDVLNQKQPEEILYDKFNEVVKKHEDYIGDDYATYVGNPTVLLEDLRRVLLEYKSTEEEKKELKCMKCGSKENLNSNRDNSFVECDKCMWEKDEPDKIDECINEFMRFLEGHKLVKKVHFYRGDGEREIIIKLI